MFVMYIPLLSVSECKLPIKQQNSLLQEAILLRTISHIQEGGCRLSYCGRNVGKMTRKQGKERRKRTCENWKCVLLTEQRSMLWLVLQSWRVYCARPFI